MIKYRVVRGTQFRVSAEHNKASMHILWQNFKIMGKTLTMNQCIDGMNHQPPPSRDTGHPVTNNQAFIHYLCKHNFLERVEEAHYNDQLMVRLLKEEGIRHQLFNAGRPDWLITVEHENCPTEIVTAETKVCKLWWLR